MAEHNKIGKWGESTAAQHLRQKGYKILEQNIRLYGIEIDIIAQKDDELVFVEVKTRTNNLLPYELLFSKNQRNRMVRAANFYVQKKNIDAQVRFDLILISRTQNGKFHIEHIENAFYPQW